MCLRIRFKKVFITYLFLLYLHLKYRIYFCFTRFKNIYMYDLIEYNILALPVNRPRYLKVSSQLMFVTN